MITIVKRLLIEPNMERKTLVRKKFFSFVIEQKRFCFVLESVFPFKLDRSWKSIITQSACKGRMHILGSSHIDDDQSNPDNDAIENLRDDSSILTRN